MKNLFKSYSKLNQKILSLEAERQMLREEILETMRKENESRIESAYGKFTRASRKTYRYSEAIENMVEKLKIAKKKEEQKGVAVAEATEYLVYTPPYEQENQS